MEKKKISIDLDAKEILKKEVEFVNSLGAITSEEKNKIIANLDDFNETEIKSLCFAATQVGLVEVIHFVDFLTNSIESLKKEFVKVNKYLSEKKA